jgi:hypothetical protein
MILANITTYIGQDADAQHYYCSYVKKTCDGLPKEHYSEGSSDREYLSRIVDDPLEVKRMKASGSRWYIGQVTTQYVSIDQIHQQLKTTFADQDIITYYEHRLFKNTMFIKDGVDVGIAIFGEIWTTVPSSYYKDLISDDVIVKIRCCYCGHEYTLDEVTYQQDTIDNDGNKRDWVRFTRKRDMDDTCCREFDLEWNVTL